MNVTEQSISAFASENEYHEAREWWKKRRRFRYAMQKVIGVLTILCGITWSVVLKEDQTHLLIFIPVGLCAIFSRSYIFYDEFQRIDQIMDPVRYGYGKRKHGL